MNIDADAKRRFVRRLLEFIGYDVAAIEVACAATGLVGRKWRSLLVA
jgi:hypothetical protein